MSNELLLGGMIPMRYIPQQEPTKYDQVIIVGWLDIEVDAAETQRAPVLKRISGHRNREVYGFIKSTNDEWFNRMATQMYGRMR